ncbi:MAG: hypothetical protein ISS76_15460 [Phycisphaerae bacterium]|nr:hypothetical protein [Phycisphaerae bacterium]
MASSENSGSNKQAAGKGVEEEASIYEDEIDLREYVQVLVKRKKLIIGIFLVAVISAAIASLFLPKVYKASASIMVTPSKIQSVLSPARLFLDPGKERQGEYVVQKPTISIPTHRTLLMSTGVLQRVMTSLKSAGKLDEDLAIEGFSGRLEVKGTEETNVLSLSVKDHDPGRASEAANIWAEEYIKYSQKLIGGEILGSGKFVLEQFKRAEDDLAKADAAVKDFDVKERLSLMEIELAEDVNQLVSHYEKVHKLGFTLAEKRYLLLRTDENIAAMTKDGVWIGAFGITALGEKQFADESLNDTQRALRQKTLRVKLAFETSRKKRDGFVNESGIDSLKAEVTRKRDDLLDDKALLAQIRELSEATKANLKSENRLETLKQFQGPIAENMSDLTIWEILSLAEGYNFFDTRGQSLTAKVDKQGKELKELEKAVFDCNDQLGILEENLDRAQLDYDFYHEKFKALVEEKNSAELEIARLEYELAYSRDMVSKLEGKVETLKTLINEKTLKLAELEREFAIETKAYESMASKVEEARIAQAMELGEVKTVSTAFEPQYPVAPRKKLIVAIAGFVSLMLGIFAAFCLEVWQKSDTRTS